VSRLAVTALQKIPYFAGLPEPVIADLGQAAVKRHFEARQVIYLEGETAESIFILETGWVKATRMTRDGREQAMAFMRPGEIFGDIAAFIEQPYPTTVTALEPVEVWVLQAKEFVGLIERHPALAMAVIRWLGSQVVYFIGLVEDLSLRSVEARLAHTLLRNAETQEGRLVVPRREWTTFDEMSVRLGTVRDVLSRALKTLEAEGLLRVEKQAIVLLDPDGLARRGDL
jgi:CRP/FNR family transcriptional regulator